MTNPDRPLTARMLAVIATIALALALALALSACSPTSADRAYHTTLYDTAHTRAFTLTYGLYPAAYSDSYAGRGTAYDHCRHTTDPIRVTANDYQSGVLDITIYFDDGDLITLTADRHGTGEWRASWRGGILGTAYTYTNTNANVTIHIDLNAITPTPC